MAASELPLALDWAAAEGWNPGLQDADSFVAADPQGFLLGLRGGEPIGCISAVRYGDNFGFLGFYIVRPLWRGRGHGRQLSNAALERLEGRTIGLDGVVAQQANYRASGFQFVFLSLRHQGPVAAAGPRDGEAGAVHGDGIVALASRPLQELLAYDAPFSPSGRAAFLSAWLRQSGSQALGLVRCGVLAGYGVVRPCREGFKIGPLFADDPEAAEHLFRALRAQVPSPGPLILDTPVPNGAALALAAAHGLFPVSETARMVRGPAPALPLERLFGLTSFELG
ncbi:GNAT family N-acetyltransferase [Cyanobium sp. Morenito 9A2]|uniref:GNAT family N-acetyltransferase n=1 Tax=Cyanobium sp. Morenito 9A2 TaxID=2823718 RepID=UPI0020CFD847|nr:GNAT family N-acetyltransferase [Cyanobium sp. Morenito 9A2]MCP9850992.1 GNAT family N-acetyltransferase [Cyanobium sp. Morenito 9A2]